MYPSNSEMAPSEAALEFIPDSLKTFLKIVFAGKDVKLASIVQAIMEAARPRVLMTPLLIGMGVQMHHHLESKFLIESLNSHDFSCSYDEVKRHAPCASMAEHEIPQNDGPQNFLQYAADNVDHNIRTLDGKNTFYGTGIIAAFTPGINVEAKIRRTNVTANDIAAIGCISNHSFSSKTDILSSIRYEHFSDPMIEYSHSAVDFIWKTSLYIQWIGLSGLDSCKWLLLLSIHSLDPCLWG